MTVIVASRLFADEYLMDSVDPTFKKELKVWEELSPLFQFSSHVVLYFRSCSNNNS